MNAEKVAEARCASANALAASFCQVADEKCADEGVVLLALAQAMASRALGPIDMIEAAQVAAVLAKTVLHAALSIKIVQKFGRPT